MRWHVVQVMTGEEKGIAAKLRQAGFRVLVPAENRPIHTGGAWGMKEYALFPGYVFLQMDYDAGAYYRLKGIPGVVKLLSGTLSYLEAEWILLLSGQNGEPLTPTLVREADGRLEVQDGILKRFESRIVKMDKRNRRAVIELSLCGEKKEVQLGIRLPGEEAPANTEESPARTETKESGSGQAADG